MPQAPAVAAINDLPDAGSYRVLRVSHGPVVRRATIRPSFVVGRWLELTRHPALEARFRGFPSIPRPAAVTSEASDQCTSLSFAPPWWRMSKMLLIEPAAGQRPSRCGASELRSTSRWRFFFVALDGAG